MLVLKWKQAADGFWSARCACKIDNGDGRSTGTILYRYRTNDLVEAERHHFLQRQKCKLLISCGPAEL